MGYKQVADLFENMACSGWVEERTPVPWKALADHMGLALSVGSVDILVALEVVEMTFADCDGETVQENFVHPTCRAALLDGFYCHHRTYSLMSQNPFAAVGPPSLSSS